MSNECCNLQMIANTIAFPDSVASSIGFWKEVLYEYEYFHLEWRRGRLLFENKVGSKWCARVCSSWFVQGSFEVRSNNMSCIVRVEFIWFLNLYLESILNRLVLFVLYKVLSVLSTCTCTSRSTCTYLQSNLFIRFTCRRACLVAVLLTSTQVGFFF